MRGHRITWIIILVAVSGVLLAGAAWTFRKTDLYTVPVDSGTGNLTVPAKPIVLTPSLQSRLMALEPIREGIRTAAFGERPVLVTFFASWCPPCAQEFDELTDFLDEQGTESISIIAVNWHEGTHGGYDQGRMKRMLNRIHDAIPVVTGTEELNLAFGGVESIPATYIFHRRVEIARLGGDPGPNGRYYLTRPELERALKELTR